MSIRAYIERARRAQQENPQMHPVQLEIPEPESGRTNDAFDKMGCIISRPEDFNSLWASDDERTERFRSETFEHEIHAQVVRRYAALLNPEGVEDGSAPIYAKAIPGRPGWRIDSEGREWYSAAWL